MPRSRALRRTLGATCAAGLPLAAAVAALSSTACGRVTTAGSSDTAYVGVAVGLQSPERYANVFRGVQFALDELNARRPPGAPPLGLRRPSADARSAIEVATAFRDDPSVVGVVGHTETDATIDAAAIYGDQADAGAHALVAVAPTAAGGLVTRMNDWVFRVCPVVARQGEVLAAYTADSLGIHRAAVVFRNDAAGKEFVRAFADAFHARGGTLVERDPFTEDVAEFDAYAQRISKRAVGAVVLYANAGDAGSAMRAIRAAGASPRFLGTNGPAASDSLAPDFAGLRYTALYVPSRPATPAGQRFAHDFPAAAHTPADHWAALGYDAAMLVGEAVQSVGRDRHAVRDWVASVGRSRPAYDGATGRIVFDSVGDPVAKAMVVRTVGE